jgi:hypothetical protein
VTGRPLTSPQTLRYKEFNYPNFRREQWGLDFDTTEFKNQFDGLYNHLIQKEDILPKMLKVAKNAETWSRPLFA